MPSFTNPTWEATYPEGWTSEEADDSIAFYDPEADVGTLQVSCICTDDPVTDEDLLAMAEDIISAGKRYSKVQVGELAGIMFRYYDGDDAWKEWYLAAGNCLFFVTYDCSREAEGAEDEEVAEILESLRVIGEG
jgi:hypothetical protein